MRKSIYSPLYDIFIGRIRELRRKANLTQRDLAKRLDVPHGTVARIELGERRVDVAECYQLLKSLEVDPSKELAALMRQFAECDRQDSLTTKRKKSGP